MNQDAYALRNAEMLPGVFRFGPQEPSQNELWRRFPKRHKNAPETARPAYEFACARGD
jgi:hypothetical protein